MNNALTAPLDGLAEPETVFPHGISHTLLSDFRRCPHKAWRRRLQRLVPNTDGSIDLHFGKAFASAIEAGRRAFYQDGARPSLAGLISMETAFALYQKDCPPIPAKSNKTFERLVAAVTHYWQTWPLGEDGLTPVNDGIEYEFSIEIPFTHPVDGKPLFYTGKMDLVAKNDMGGVVVVDEKTAGSFSDAWLAQWDMDAQMSGYLWAVGAFCAPDTTPHALIRGISVGTKVGHILLPVFRTQWQIDVWHAQMLRDVQRLLWMYKGGIWDRNLGDACVAYGRPCDYTPLCLSPNAGQFIKENFKVVPRRLLDTPQPRLLQDGDTKGES